MIREAIRIEGLFVSDGLLMLKNINLSLSVGSITALVGLAESGASLLAELFAGTQEPRQGKVYINEKRVPLEKLPRELNRQIYVLGESSSLLPEMSAAENVFLLRREGLRRFLLYKRDMEKQVQSYFKMVGLFLAPNEPVGRLSVAEQHCVEIAKAICLGKKIILFRHSLEGYTQGDVEKLLTLMGELTRRDVTFIIHSRAMAALQSIVDTTVVFRDGQIVKKLPPGAVEEREMAAYLLGFSPPDSNRPAPCDIGEALFELQDGLLEEAVQVHRGEIIIFACGGDGEKWELAQSIKRTARAFLDKSEKDQDKFIFVEPYRDIHRLFLNLPPWENMLLPSMRKISRPLGVLSGQYRAVIEKEYGKLWGDCESVKELSEKQRLALAMTRWLITGPEIVVVMEPFLHADLEQREIVMDFITKASSEGAAVLLLTARHPEEDAYGAQIVRLTRCKDV